MDHESSSHNHIMMLLKEMVDVAYRDLIDMMDAARRALRKIIDMGIRVGQWLLDKLISLLGLVQQGIEEEFNQTRAAVHKLLEPAIDTTTFIGNCQDFFVCLGVNIVRYAIGNISGTELILQTTTSFAKLINIRGNVSFKPLIAAGTGATIGGIIGTFLVPVPGFGTALGYAAGGFIAGSFLGVVAASRDT